MVISDEEQAIITEKLALIKEYYAEKEPDHFLILVGNKETLVDAMSCNSHDQAVVEQMLSGGNPRFLYLARQKKPSPKEPLTENTWSDNTTTKRRSDYREQFSCNLHHGSSVEFLIKEDN